MLIDFTKLISALEGHTAALLEHAKALASGGTDAPKAARGRKAAGEAEGKAQTVTEVAASSAAASGVVTAAVQPSAVTSPVTSTPSAEPKVVTQPTLQQVADKIIELANSPTGGRDKAVAILTKYGVKKVPELKPETFEAVLKDVAAAYTPSASDGLT